MKWVLVLFLAGTILGASGPCGVAAPATLEWRSEKPGYKWAPLEVDRTDRQGFTVLRASTTGVEFANRLSEEEIAKNRVLPNGSGVAIGDYDGDGLPDLFFCGLSVPNALYRNLGDWRFEEVTKEAGLQFSPGYYRGTVFADLNGDQHLDLLVSTLERGVLCFLNDGKRGFKDATAQANTLNRYGAMTLALADVDGNGTLDLYIVNNRPDDIRDRGEVNLTMRNGRVIIPPKYRDRLIYTGNQLLEYGNPDVLLLNNGKGEFEEADWKSGRFLNANGNRLEQVPLDWGLAASFRDMNGDRLPDLYVCNDYWTPDRIWINQGEGRFQALPDEALGKTSASSMGIDFADLDRDGDLDFFVADMLSRDPRLRKRQKPALMPPQDFMETVGPRRQLMRNTLFENREDNTYAELAWWAGVAASDWSWSPLFTDVDLDGWPDLLISAGHFRDVQDRDANLAIRRRQGARKQIRDPEQRRKVFVQEMLEHNRLYPALDMPIVAFRNRGNFQFEEVTGQWNTDQAGVHHGMATGDLDGDGDLDLVVNNLNAPAGFYRNESDRPRIAVRLKGEPPNTQGIGSRVTMSGGGAPVQTQEVVSGGRYLSGSDPLLAFAAGDSGGKQAIEVRWRSGRVTRVEWVQPNRIYSIREPSESDARASPRAPMETADPTEPLFQKVQREWDYRADRIAYDDFSRQPLLPFKWSENGPGLSWYDLTGDGQCELIVGTGRGGKPGVWTYENDSLVPVPLRGVNEVPDDTTGLLGWRTPSGRIGVWMGLSAYENPEANGSIHFEWDDGALKPSPNSDSAIRATGTGHLSMADLDGDDRLELLTIGYVVPGKYPNSTPITVHRFRGGHWQVDRQLQVSLPPGCVPNGAVWSDLTGDGLPELILACEWGPLRIFEFRQGRLFETTPDWGLSEWTGLWKGVAAGDFNGDGRMDLIASNWGLNSPWKAEPDRPLVMVYGELFRPGSVDLIETEYLPGTDRLTPSRFLSDLAPSLPFLQARFNSFKQYSEATLEQTLGQRKVLARRLEARTLASMLFLNRNGRFEPVKLPRQAQLSPGFGVAVGDFNGDGTEDAFLCQNFVPVRSPWSQLDNGRGLVLIGDGKGGLEVLTFDEAGIRIEGQQRGAAVCDFDGDGRLDLAASQNGRAPLVFRNVGSPIGLRIRLHGPPGNRDAIGAVMRVKTEGEWGPAREVHAGSGYWSQSSPEQIMHGKDGRRPESIWVRWPGGETMEKAIPASGRLIDLKHPRLKD